jgi:hypothetical protein
LFLKISLDLVNVEDSAPFVKSVIEIYKSIDAAVLTVVGFAMGLVCNRQPLFHLNKLANFVSSNFPVYNFYDVIISRPDFHRQLNCRGTLITLFNCPLENKFEDMWSHHNYIVCVMEGRKIWHTALGSYDLRPGSCFFVRKGACIVEQFFDAVFCIVLFFIPDQFICDVLKSK